MILALDEAWVGVVGVAIGGLFGFVGSWLVHRSERTERLAERVDGYVAARTLALSRRFWGSRLIADGRLQRA